MDSGAGWNFRRRSGAEEFLEHTKMDLYHDQVFCFTPRGDLIALPGQRRLISPTLFTQKSVKNVVAFVLTKTVSLQLNWKMVTRLIL